MAKKIINIIDKTMAVFQLYDLNAPVGKGSRAVNRRSDVALVQCLLHDAFVDLDGQSPNRELFAQRLDKPVLTGPLAIDGKYGPVTEAYMRTFFEYCRKQMPAGNNDGIYDPVSSGHKYMGMRKPFSKRHFFRIMVGLNFFSHIKFPGIPGGTREPLENRVGFCPEYLLSELRAPAVKVDF